MSGPPLLRCDWCNQPWPPSLLDSNDLCPDCRDEPADAEDWRDEGADGLQLCPSCEEWVERLAPIEARTGGPVRHVCDVCHTAALESEPSFWQWYWHG